VIITLSTKTIKATMYCAATLYQYTCVNWQRKLCPLKCDAIVVKERLHYRVL